MSPSIALTAVPATSTLLGGAAALVNLLPPWVPIMLFVVTVVLAVVDAVVTQIIRLRASTKITRSRDATAVLSRCRHRR